MRQAKLVILIAVSVLIVVSVLTDYDCEAGQIKGKSHRQHKIAFTSIRDENWEIYVMNADGSGQKNLTNNPGMDEEPRWSPDGRKIVFLSRRDGRPEIYVMNADGSEQKRLTNGPGRLTEPQWSPDGTRILFQSSIGTGWPERKEDCEIHVMNADGSEQKNLTNNPDSDYDAQWSNDGTKIAFQSNRDGQQEIYIMNPDGTGLKNLTNNVDADVQPRWSPDGKKIAFMSGRGGNIEIYVMNADGSEQERLSDGSALINMDSQWSPDGRKIAFISGESYREVAICVVNADGSEQEYITNDCVAGDPRWSPDGRKIAFLSYKPRIRFSPDNKTRAEIYVMNPDGSEKKQLTDTGRDWNPVWSPVPLPTKEP